MKRITLILKTSEVMSVRKAACIAGANSIVVHPSHRGCSAYPNPLVSAQDELVRLDLMVVDSQSGEVVCAILATAHSGKIENISPVNAKHALSASWQHNELLVCSS